MSPRILVETSNPASTCFQNYMNAVKAGGGEPVASTPSARIRLSDVKGILLTGGEDIDPAVYGEKTDPRSVLLAKDRQDYVLELAKIAHEKKIPCLAICLGCQVINVALGGTLYQHIPGHSNSWHDIYFVDKLAAAIFGKEIAAVNSFHHQTIKVLTPELKVCAYSSDNVVEMVASRDHQFYVGVQWHPERMLDRPDQVELFKKFVASCR